MYSTGGKEERDLNQLRKKGGVNGLKCIKWRWGRKVLEQRDQLRIGGIRRSGGPWTAAEAMFWV